MKLRIISCISLCFLIQHVSAMDWKTLERFKQELPSLYVRATDAHNTIEVRLEAVQRARIVIDAIKSARSQSNPHFSSGAFKGVSWGNVTVLGNGYAEVDAQLARIAADLSPRDVATEAAVDAARSESALTAARHELAELRRELTETQAQFALLGERYGDEIEGHARELAQARAKINALETMCQQQEVRVKELIDIAEERTRRIEQELRKDSEERRLTRKRN